MSTFINSNFGAGMGSYWMSQNAIKASDAAAKLASGMRVSGKAGGGDVVAYYTQRATAVTAEQTARTTANDASEAYGNVALADSMLLLWAKHEETGDASEKLAIESALEDIFGAFATPGTATYALTGDETDPETLYGEVAGVAAGLEAMANGQAASASIARDAAENFIAVDYGTETANVTRYQILQQAAAAMVAQANQSQNAILALLK